MKFNFVFAILFLIISFAIFSLDNREESEINADAVLEVKGMTCALCSVAIEKSLVTSEWIKNVNADHLTGLVSVIFKDSFIESIIEQITFYELFEELENKISNVGGFELILLELKKEKIKDFFGEVIYRKGEQIIQIYTNIKESAVPRSLDFNACC